MVKKTSTADLVTKVYRALTPQPQTINEIAANTKIIWESAKNSLTILESLGLTEKRGDKYILKEIIKNPSTLFGIRLDREDEIMIDTLFSKIKEEWIKQKGVPPGKTQVQKCLAMINDECGLNLPIGWYLYGQICIKPYDPMFTYTIQRPIENENVIQCVPKSVRVCSAHKSISKLETDHYLNNPLYSIKKRSFDIGYSNRFTKELFSNFCYETSNIIYNLNKTSQTSETIKLVTEFVAIIYQISTKFADEELQEIKSQILDALNDVWKLIALDSYFESLLKTGKYTETELASYFAMPRFFQQEIVEDALSNLSSKLLPYSYKNVDPSDPLLKLKGDETVEPKAVDSTC